MMPDDFRPTTTLEVLLYSILQELRETRAELERVRKAMTPEPEPAAPEGVVDLKEAKAKRRRRRGAGK